MHPQVYIIGISGIPEVRPGDDLVVLILQAAEKQGTPVQENDLLVVTQKIVSKAEGRVIKLSDIKPSELALQLAREYQRDPRHIEVVLRESTNILRMVRGVIISETRHGFKCANAGVDASNLPDTDTICLLPQDPDASAQRIHQGINERLGIYIAVIITDSFGRPWREGIVNVAIGVAGLSPLKDLRGTRDFYGHVLLSSVLAVADELAAAAGLVMPKAAGIPAALVRGYNYERGSGSSKQLLRPPETDLFR